jgi:hypothetical protein
MEYHLKNLVTFITKLKGDDEYETYNSYS